MRTHLIPAFVVSIVLAFATPARAAISDNLIGYWNFDEGSGLTLLDQTANADHGELRNFPGDNSQWIPGGRIGGALAFDGVNDYIFVTNYPKPTSTLTITAWVIANARPSFATIIKNWPSANQQFHFGLEGTAGDVSNYIKPQGLAQVGPVREGAASPIPLGSWQHVALVCNGTNMQIYRNGSPVGASLAYNGTIQTNPVNASLSIGAKWISAVSADSYWNGRMDDLGLWSRALSASEILAIYVAGLQNQPLTAAVDGPVAPFITAQPQGFTRNAGEAGPSLTVGAAGTPTLTYQWRQAGTNIPGATSVSLAFPAPIAASKAGNYEVVVSNGAGSVTSAPAAVVVQPVATISDALVGYWNFDEGTGAVLIDNSGSGNDGTLVNFPGDNSQWTAGRVAGALQFGGPASLQYVTVPNYPKPGSTLTLCAWVYADARPTWATVAKNWQTVPTAQFHLGLDNTTGDLSNYLVPQNGAQIGPVREGAGTPLPLASWQHIALVCDGQNMRLYRNGIPVGAAFAYNGTINTNPVALPLGIGVKLGPGGVPVTGADSGYWQGKIDDLGLWARGLTPDEIFAIYRTGTNGQPLTTAPLGTEPVITVQPQGVTRYAGEYASALSVAVVGTAPTFQWRKDNVDLPGANASTFPLGLVSPSLAGAYTVVVTNSFGSVTSAPAAVVVQSVPGVTEALAGYWNFDEGAGTLLVDNSGNGNDGTLVNYPDNSSWMSGQIGGALNFGGPTTSNHIVVPNYPKPSSTMTISAWVLATSRPTWATILKNWPASGQQFHLGLDNTTGDLSNYLIQQGGTQLGPVREGTSTPLPTNSWQHIALVCDGQSMRLYRNGVPVGTPLAYNGSINTNLASQAMGIGVKLLATGLPDTGSPGWWHGKMDDLGLWRRGLTSNEVNAIYRAGCGAFSLSEADLSAVLPTITQNPASRTNFVGTSTTFTAAATAGGGTVHYQWLFNGALVAGQTASTLTLANIQPSQGGDYRVVAASAAGCVTGAVATLTVVANGTPIAGTAQAATPMNTAVAVPKTTLLAVCSDPDNDTLTVTAAGPTSTNGGSVALTANHVLYTPVAGFVGTDRFSFTVSDGRGGQATGTVVVGVYNPGPAYNRVALTLGGGQAHLAYTGAPGLTYTILRAPSLPPAWASIGTALADGAGQLNFTDPNPPAGAAFYQLQLP